jgi:hypothetical protein
MRSSRKSHATRMRIPNGCSSPPRDRRSVSPDSPTSVGGEIPRQERTGRRAITKNC